MLTCQAVVMSEQLGRVLPAVVRVKNNGIIQARLPQNDGTMGLLTRDSPRTMTGNANHGLRHTTVKWPVRSENNEIIPE